jgi:hypothetical protein
MDIFATLQDCRMPKIMRNAIIRTAVLEDNKAMTVDNGFFFRRDSGFVSIVLVEFTIFDR